MKKFLSIMLAAAMALTLTACNNSSTSSSAPESTSGSEAETPAQSGTAQAASTAEAQEPDSGEKPVLSNPVKLNADGDIDMDTALAYQTDFDALKASFEAKEVDI